MKKTVLFLVIAFNLSSFFIQAQGCSDAGFCTIEAFKPEGLFQEKTVKNQIKTGLNLGMADNDISVFGQYIEYTYSLNNRFNLGTKITSLSQSGNNISVFGLSDLYLNGNYNINEKITLTAGVKIPLTNANTKKNGESLPMDYQSSLGTFDLILGVGYKWNKINLAFAYQQPLTQNKNTYIAPNNLQENLTYYTTENYNRKGDVLLRVSYPLKISNKVKITPSLLPIYHLANDTFSNENIEITDSKGLTLNANAYFDYKLNAKNNLQFSLGLPLKVRNSRPDGLTRKFVANIEYSFHF